MRFPQRDRDRFQRWELAQHLLRQLAILRRIELARVYVHIGLNAQRHLAIFLVRDRDIDGLHQLLHHLGRRLAPFPQILAIVQIARYGQSAILAPARTDSSASSAQEALNAGVMPVMWNQPAPSKTCSQLISPGFASAIDVILAIVDHLRRPLIRAGLDEIDPHSALGARTIFEVSTPKRRISATTASAIGLLGGSTVT